MSQGPFPSLSGASSLRECRVSFRHSNFLCFGPVAGFLTLSFATIGFLAKLLADDIEEIDETQAEAIRATGASWPQLVNHAVQPQVMPRPIGLWLCRLDINFRESAVIGMVGGGRHRRDAEHRHRPP